MVEGPMARAEANRILFDMRPTLWQQLGGLLIDEDEELRYGMTTPEDSSVVLDVAVHFRVSNLAAAVEMIERLYVASDFRWPAKVYVYGARGDVVHEYTIRPAGH